MVAKRDLAREVTCGKGTIPAHDVVIGNHWSAPFRYVCNTDNYITEVCEMQAFSGVLILHAYINVTILAL